MTIPPDHSTRIVRDLARRFPADHQLGITPKSWGYEAEIINCADYCGKILVFFAGTAGSQHFHMKKHETWFVLAGMGTVTMHDPVTGNPTVYPLEPGRVIDLPRGRDHKVRADATMDLVLVEVSTPHEDADTYRLSPPTATFP